jgi:hypothetical protein
MANFTGVVYTIPTSQETTDASDSFAFQQLNLSVTKYLNSGYYVTGSVYEYWITYNTKGSVPPSGHSLVNVQYVIIK